MAVHAHVQRLEAAQDEEGAERRHDAARVDAHRADGLDVGAPPGHDAGDDVGVAAQPLGGRFDDQVDPELERLAEVGRGEGVVDDHRGAMAMGELGEPPEVCHHDAGVGDGLGIEKARRRSRQRRLDGGSVGGVHVARPRRRDERGCDRGASACCRTPRAWRRCGRRRGRARGAWRGWPPSRSRRRSRPPRRAARRRRRRGRWRWGSRCASTCSRACANPMSAA